MADVSLDELAQQVQDAADTRLRALVRVVLEKATADLEDRARANIQARLVERSRSLASSLRTEIATQGDELVGTVSAGGDWQGLHVPYARLQEYGGTILPKNAKHLAIPTKEALTGPGIPKYDSPRQVPYGSVVMFRQPRGKLRGLVIDKRTKGEGLKVYFLLVTDSTIRPKRYLRDAWSTVVAELPERVARAAAAALGAA